jgi:HK97 family phage major capsid protein
MEPTKMSKRLLSELRAERGSLIDEMTSLTESREFDPKKFGELQTQLAAFDAQIAAGEQTQALQRTLARPAGIDTATSEDLGAGDMSDLWRQYGGLSPNSRVDGPRTTRAELGGNVANFGGYVRHARSSLPGFALDNSKHFRSLGEMLQAVFMHYQTRGAQADPRLIRTTDADSMFNRAPSGASEVDPTGGGFLVQIDFATAIFMLAHDMGEILSRVNKLPISANANGLKVPGVDETSRATGSRWGGVQSYWAAEGNSVTLSKPKFRLVEFDLKKLFSTMYTTDELLQDTSALSTIAGQAFSEEIMFMTEDAIFEGSGAGQPLGVLNAPATVSVAKETGQGAATILKENIDKMWMRCWTRSRKNSAWFINQDCEPALQSLVQVVGTGGAPVYIPPGGYRDAPHATLLGRPVIPTEYNATVGTVGDIMLADFSQYTLVDKNGVQAATSMHVAFLTDEMVFRITYRVDGKPMWHSALTPFKGSATKSPFITLATRA